MGVDFVQKAVVTLTHNTDKWKWWERDTGETMDVDKEIQKIVIYLAGRYIATCL